MYQLIHFIEPISPASSEDFLSRLEKITIFNSLITDVESFIDFSFEGENFTLHWELNRWIVTNYNKNVTKETFEQLCRYLDEHNHHRLYHYLQNNLAKIVKIFHKDSE